MRIYFSHACLADCFLKVRSHLAKPTMLAQHHDALDAPVSNEQPVKDATARAGNSIACVRPHHDDMARKHDESSEFRTRGPSHFLDHLGFIAQQLSCNDTIDPVCEPGTSYHGRNDYNTCSNDIHYPYHQERRDLLPPPPPPPPPEEQCLPVRTSAAGLVGIEDRPMIAASAVRSTPVHLPPMKIPHDHTHTYHAYPYMHPHPHPHPHYTNPHPQTDFQRGYQLNPIHAHTSRDASSTGSHYDAYRDIQPHQHPHQQCEHQPTHCTKRKRTNTSSYATTTAARGEEGERRADVQHDKTAASHAAEGLSESAGDRSASMSVCSGDAADQDAVSRRKQFLERNRVAASKCRQKKKEWMQGLEARSTEIFQHNVRLEAQLGRLQDEVAMLRHTLGALVQRCTCQATERPLGAQQGQE
ncbi:hypothetical protein BC831DRAFT_547399 [Entophlyctis helioformis]|nr:hypothetical protein BC831DRAFT_547399 [Entophlyctis helioformis]